MYQKVKKEIITPQYYSFHQSYGYDLKERVWKFIGYRCMFCERTIKTTKAMDKHYTKCRSKKRNPEKEQGTENIIKKFTVLETNQK